MGAIIVLLELEPATEVLGGSVGDAGEVDIGARVRYVHAAGSDPDAPGDPLPRTLCGLDITALEPEAYLPAWPGGPWYPPEYRSRRCPACEVALQDG
ncbi:hypothetical protein [Streptacidiphilus sp. MAP12-20]|uniref:hypothetical protein n=1 Tax=Streptacidiphilus sp. MAP12-20 TaxID=3156299 RepID=UPI003513F686